MSQGNKTGIVPKKGEPSYTPGIRYPALASRKKRERRNPCPFFPTLRIECTSKHQSANVRARNSVFVPLGAPKRYLYVGSRFQEH